MTSEQSGMIMCVPTMKRDCDRWYCGSNCVSYTHQQKQSEVITSHKEVKHQKQPVAIGSPPETHVDRYVYGFTFLWLAQELLWTSPGTVRIVLVKTNLMVYMSYQRSRIIVYPEVSTYTIKQNQILHSYKISYAKL